MRQNLPHPRIYMNVTVVCDTTRPFTNLGAIAGPTPIYSPKKLSGVRVVPEHLIDFFEVQNTSGLHQPRPTLSSAASSARSLSACFWALLRKSRESSSTSWPAAFAAAAPH